MCDEMPIAPSWSVFPVAKSFSVFVLYEYGRKSDSVWRMIFRRVVTYDQLNISTGWKGEEIRTVLVALGMPPRSRRKAARGGVKTVLARPQLQPESPSRELDEDPLAMSPLHRGKRTRRSSFRDSVAGPSGWNGMVNDDMHTDDLVPPSDEEEFKDWRKGGVDDQAGCVLSPGNENVTMELEKDALTDERSIRQVRFEV